MYENQMNILDLNGDGQEDYWQQSIDIDGDGVADGVLEAIDTNNTSRPDTAIIQIDSNHDGILDTVVKNYDYNDDQQLDSNTTYQDLNGDGRMDQVTKTWDSDGDGQLDHTEVLQDMNGDGEADAKESYLFDPNTGQLTPIEHIGMESIQYAAQQQFTPSDNYPEGVDGDPLKAMERWECQGNTNRCALYSQKFIIEEFTGQEIDIEKFAAFAEANGWFDENSGTNALNMDKMLTACGIEHEMGFHKSIDDIQECLQKGGRVIVSIDADEIWKGAAHDVFSPYSGANHAVEVIGIDRTDPEHPMVILNDSGTPNGCGEMVPLDTFLKTWEDGDCQMISCYPNK